MPRSAAANAQRIEGHDPVPAGIEQDEVGGALRREAIEAGSHRVTFGIDESETASGSKVGEHGVQSEGRLAGAGATEDQRMQPPLSRSQEDRPTFRVVAQSQLACTSLSYTPNDAGRLAQAGNL